MANELELEPIAKDAIPEDLRRFPDAVAMEMYGYHAVRRGPARAFYKEYEDSLRVRIGKQKAAFRVHDAVLFCGSRCRWGNRQSGLRCTITHRQSHPATTQGNRGA